MAFATRCAALLHDIGHGPLSHVFESFMGTHHESWTRRIILDPGSAVHQVLHTYHAALPGEVAGIIDGKSHPGFLSQIISSQLDCDRFDYLLRDSEMTGVKYGIFDLERLLHVLRLDERGENIVVSASGVQPVEKYLQARYHMYSQVYLHKTVRAGETVFARLLNRASDLACKGKLDGVAEGEPLAHLLTEKSEASLESYLQADDNLLLAAVERWTRSNDEVLRDLSTRITERKLFKSLDVTHVKGLGGKVVEAKAAITEAGLDPRYYFALDMSGDVPYRPYNPALPEKAGHILIENSAGSGETVDIIRASEVVAGLARAAFAVKRAMFPAMAGNTDLRRKMAAIFYDRHTAETFLPSY
jgi:HD superfamily phosphohydrolase